MDFQNSAHNRTFVTSDNTIYKYVITMMVIVLTIIPHTVQAQWDIDTVDDPAPSLDEH